MSGVEDVIDPPPDNSEKSDQKEDTKDGKEEGKFSLTTSVTDSESAILTESNTESWTILDKEEDNSLKVMIIK